MIQQHTSRKYIYIQIAQSAPPRLDKALEMHTQRFHFESGKLKGFIETSADVASQCISPASKTFLIGISIALIAIFLIYALYYICVIILFFFY